MDNVTPLYGIVIVGLLLAVWFLVQSGQRDIVYLSSPVRNVGWDDHEVFRRDPYHYHTMHRRPRHYASR